MKLGSFLDSLREDGDASIVLLQEYPKCAQGWSKPTTWGRFTLLTHQPRSGYRGTGIAFNNSKWTFLKRKATEHGTWCLLLRNKGGKKIWFGSGYLSTGVGKDEHTSEVQSLLEGLPANAETVVPGADLNTRLDWAQCGDQKAISSSMGKTQAMLDHFGTRRLQGIPQLDVQAPTFWTRKTPSSSSQIDGFFTNSLGRFILSTKLVLRRAEVQRRRIGGPRVVKPGAVIQAHEVRHLDQHAIQKLAEKYTVPLPRVGFRVPPSVKALGRIARSTRNPMDWISYCKALRDARVEWRESKFNDASHDWSSFHWAKKQKAPRWQESFAAAQDTNPVQAIQTHFQGVFACGHSDVDANLRSLQESMPDNFVAFDPSEIRTAIFQGANRKAVGIDGVPQELLKAIASVDQGMRALQSFFDTVVKERSHPKVWYKSLMSLRPKTCCPMVPKDLRPVCLTSHLSKTFARLIMSRIIHKVVPDSPFQCCALQRQTTDYIWAIQRVMQISYEWDIPVCAIKLDIEKAFDRLGRFALGNLLVSELGEEYPTEVKNVLEMLKRATLWGTGQTEMNIGVRQSGVESATLFGWVVTKLLNELRQKWSPNGWIPDGQAEAQAFMDDIICWDGKSSRLQARITDLQHLLDRYGMKINIQKSALMCYGSVGQYSVTVDGNTLNAIDPNRETWTVMGVPVFPGTTESTHMGALIAKARAKFFALQDILLSEAPLPRKLWLMDRVIWTCVSWSVAAIFPTQSAIAMLNSF